jgi:hypothetical protein
MLVDLALANDTGPDDTDNVTTDPTLTGRILNEGWLEGVTIEFDDDGDQTADQSTTTDVLGNFSLTPDGLAHGPVTVYLRAREFDDVGGQFLYGDWVSFNFTHEQPVNTPAEVAELQLVNDLDETGTDPRATDPALLGLVTNDGPVEGLLVQFDHDGDGVIEGSAITDDEGRFTYQPLGLEIGPVTIRARAKEYDDQSTALYGGWYQFQFTLEAPPATMVEVSQLELHDDTGASSDDGCTDNPTVTGEVTGPGSIEGVSIEFDHDGDEEVDGTTTTDSSGCFTYTPDGLEEGRVTIRARTVVDDGEEPWYGDWMSVSFVFSSDPDGTDAQALATASAQYDDDCQAAEDD